MPYIGSDFKPDWDAISAVGTLAAAVIAAGIFVIDKFIQWRKSKNESHRLSCLLTSDLGTLIAVLKSVATSINSIRDNHSQITVEHALIIDSEALPSIKSALKKISVERLIRALESSTVLTKEMAKDLGLLILLAQALPYTIEAVLDTRDPTDTNLTHTATQLNLYQTIAVRLYNRMNIGVKIKSDLINLESPSTSTGQQPLA